MWGKVRKWVKKALRLPEEIKCSYDYFNDLKKQVELVDSRLDSVVYRLKNLEGRVTVGGKTVTEKKPVSSFPEKRPRKRRVVITPKLREDIFMARAEGLTAMAVAKKFDVSVNTVWRITGSGNGKAV